jgi:large subunit ribosomal protein L13
VNTLSYKTVSAKKETVTRKWFIVDAEGETVGRLSSRIASILMGKNKPSYTPHVDTGDYVIIVNAEKVRFTGNKWSDKVYLSYSLYPGGQKSTSAKEMLAKHPIRILEKSIKGMLPKTKLGNAMYKKLFVYTGNEHPHAAQKPETIKF